MNKTENYVSDIHDADYEALYLAKRLDHGTLVNADSRWRQSLNGEWSFGIDWYDTCRRAAWFKEVKQDALGLPVPVDWDWQALPLTAVPACWNLARPELLYFEGSAIYTRTFNYPPADSPSSITERVFLRFEGSQYRTSLFLNSQFIGSHDGGSTPFVVELSSRLKAENRLIVVVESRLRRDRLPPDNTDWFNYGGIYRDVYLFKTPMVYIKDWFLRLKPNSAFSSIEVDVEIGGASGALALAARLIIPELGLDEYLPVKDGRASGLVQAFPRLWSPASPKLYDLEIKLEAQVSDGRMIPMTDEQTIDRVHDRIGFREILVQGGDILLNGQPIFLKGISVHEDHLKLGKSTNESVIRETIAHLKELNGVYLRLAHYPHDSRFARIADELGVLLWEEIPVYWAVDFANPRTLADAENQLAELIIRDRNRASVIIWSVGNENADTDDRLAFMARLATKARELDGSRLVSAACLVNTTKLAIEDRLTDSLDIIGLNQYYGWYDPDFNKLAQIFENSQPEKPVIICEFGGGAQAGHRGPLDKLFTEDMQAELYRRQIQFISSCPFIKGMSPWILYDFRCPRRINRFQQGFNRKGLIDADRQSKKLAFKVLADFYAKVKLF